MTLQQDIDKYLEGFLKQVPSETLKVMQNATQELVNSELVNRSLKKGDKMPSFSLPDVDGSMVFSDELLKKGPLIISFFRGSWCPFCNLEMAVLQKILPDVNSVGATLIGVSPAKQEKLTEMKGKHEVLFPLLTDEKNVVASQFGLVFSLAEDLRPIYEQFGINIPEENGDDSFELPLPATYVVDKDGTIVYAFVNSDYTKRAEPDDIVKVLKKL